MNKIIISLILSLIVGTLIFSGINLVNAETYQVNKDINLTFPCTLNNAIPSSSATFNITVNKVGGKTIIDNEQATSLGQGLFYYQTYFVDIGTYEVIEFCYDGTYSYSNKEYFEVTPSGKSGTNNLVFFIFLILILYAINLLGFFGKNEIMTILGGMALIFLGVYMTNNGIIIYRDNLTMYFSVVTIAWGFISSLIAGYSLYENL